VIRVQFVYEGHRVKVKVTGAKRAKFPIIPAVQNFETPDSTADRAVKLARSMGFSDIADRIV